MDRHKLGFHLEIRILPETKLQETQAKGENVCPNGTVLKTDALALLPSESINKKVIISSSVMSGLSLVVDLSSVATLTSFPPRNQMSREINFKLQIYNT